MTKLTIHSNVIVFIAFLLSTIAIISKKKDSSFLQYLKNCSVIYLFIVIVTYHFILARGGEYEGIRIITNFTLHYLVPILVFINWIFFESKIIYSLKYIFYWMIYPIMYTVVSLVRGMIDGFYPYFFLNPNGEIPEGVGSYFNVFLFIIAFLFVYVLLGLFLIVINRLFLYFKNRRGIYSKEMKRKSS